VKLRDAVVGWIPLVATLQGCGLAGLVPSPSDGCTLEVVVDSNGTRESLDAPYSFAMTLPGIHGQGAVSFQGTGWQLVDVIAIRPDGSTDDTYRGEGSMINLGMVAFPVDAPGTWHFRLVDAQAHCSRELAVEVRPAPD
jgi:hypothetical protein